MAIQLASGVQHIQTGERPQFGSPYPEGIAVAARDITGDATGGVVSWTITADGGFLYRLEGLQVSRGAATIVTIHAITAHKWIANKVGVGSGSSAFDLNWFLGAASGNLAAGGGFAVYTLLGGVLGQGGSPVMEQIRRLPMGDIRKVTAQILASITVENNTDTVTHEFAAWFTYWRKESVYLPGFLSSFYEAPTVPSPLKIGA